MRSDFRGVPLVGRHVPQLDGVRLLCIFVVVQAVRDVQTLPRSGGTYYREHALRWLNSREGRGLAGTLGLAWADKPQPLTLADLPPVRQVKAFWGEEA